MRHAKDYYIEIWPQKENTDFPKSDYRSKMYKGDWVKPWMDEVIDIAVLEDKKPEDVMQRLFDKKTEHIPQTLFKFFPFNQNSLKCIEEDKIYLNEPKNFNDPYDCYLAIDQSEFVKKYLIEKLKETKATERGIITEEELRKVESSICKESRDSLNEHTFEMLGSVVTNINLNHPTSAEINKICMQAEEIYNVKASELRHDRIRVCSFSELRNEDLVSSMEMWGHYANNHSGFCVEYDLKNQILDEKLDKIIKGGILPCSYMAKQERLPNTLFYKYAMNRNMTLNQKKVFWKALIKSEINKSSSWSYEKEWRLVLTKDFVDVFNGLLPFFNVKRVYLGCKMPVLDKEYMYKLCKRKGVELYEMDLKNDYYELEPSHIDVDEKINSNQAFIDRKVSFY